jgi:hypothetical protein
MQAFMNCWKLRSVTLPESLVELGSSVFSNANNRTNLLETIIIPAGVTITGGVLFNRCANLKNVYFMPVTPPTIGNNIFNGVTTATLKIYVPLESLTAYKTAWASIYGVDVLIDLIIPYPD